jgi:transposase-like protein
LPEVTGDPAVTLGLLDEAGSPATVASAGGRYFGFVTGGSYPVAVAAGWLATAWDQNAALPVMSPVAARLQEVGTGWLADLFGLPAGTAAVAAGRRADTERRRQRVLKALETAAGTGEEISVSATARRAGVDRTFLYRHRDLLAQVHASEALPSARPAAGPAVTRASLQADLLAAHERSARLAARIRQLEHRLSDALGEQVWRESGLGQPDDIGELKQRVTRLAEENHQLRGGLAERDQDLAAARAASRELMARLNTRS